MMVQATRRPRALLVLLLLCLLGACTASRDSLASSYLQGIKERRRSKSNSGQAVKQQQQQPPPAGAATSSRGKQTVSSPTAVDTVAAISSSPPQSKRFDAKNLARHLILPGRILGAGLVGALAFQLFQLVRSVVGEKLTEWKQQKPGAGKSVYIDVDPCKSLVDILSGVEDSFKQLGVAGEENCEPSSLLQNNVVLIFDCDSKLDDSADKKARLDYFTLLGNLTAQADPSVPTRILFIPGKDNKSVMEGTPSSKGLSDWKFISSSKSGLAVASAIRSKYGVKEEELRIVVLGPDHEVTAENALDLLRTNPRGLPWTPVAFDAILGTDKLLAGLGSNETVPLVKGPTAYYFSASFCKPCKTFSPLLVSAYTNTTSMKLGGAEVVFVSLDADEEKFNELRSAFPWPSIPFRDQRRALLQMALNVKSIPALIIVDEDGKIISSSGVSQLMNDPGLAKFPWQNDVLDLGNASLVEALQRGPAIIALTENLSKDEKQQVKESLAKVSISSKRTVSFPRGPREDIIYCVIETSSKLSEALRSLCTLPKEGSHVIMLDLSSEEYAVKPASSSVAEFSRQYKNYATRQQKIATPTN